MKRSVVRGKEGEEWNRGSKVNLQCAEITQCNNATLGICQIPKKTTV